MEKNDQQTLVVIAGENHLGWQNRHLGELLKKEGVSLLMLNSRSEMGKRSLERKDLWAIIGEIEDNLDGLKANINHSHPGLYLPSFPKALSYKQGR